MHDDVTPSPPSRIEQLRNQFHLQGGRRDTKETEGPAAGKPPEDDRDLGTGQGRQKGSKQTLDTEADAGMRRRYKQQRLAGGGCGRRPGGQRSVPEKEVGSGCDREVL